MPTTKTRPVNPAPSPQKDRQPVQGGNKATIAERIKAARKKAGLTQAQLAERCGWASQTRLSHYEHARRAPRIEEVELLAKVTGVDAAWICYGGALKPHEDELLRQIIMRWQTLPPVFREYIAKKTKQVSEYTNDLPEALKRTMTAIPEGQSYADWEREIEADMAERLNQIQ